MTIEFLATMSQNYTKINYYYNWMNNVLPYREYILDMIPSNPNSLTYTIVVPDGTSEEIQNSLINSFASYSEPERWFMFHHSDDHFLTTQEISSTDYQLVQSYIQSPNSDDAAAAGSTDKTVLCDMKVIAHVSTTDTSLFSSLDLENEPVTISFKVHDKTRNVDIAEETVSINEFVSAWQTQSPSGPVEDFKTIQLYGLRDQTATYACIWQFFVKVSNPNVNVTLNGIQKLYYLQE